MQHLKNISIICFYHKLSFDSKKTLRGAFEEERAVQGMKLQGAQDSWVCLRIMKVFTFRDEDLER